MMYTVTFSVASGGAGNFAHILYVFPGSISTWLYPRCVPATSFPELSLTTKYFFFAAASTR